ncbi:MAG: peptidylprolyl isomerase [Chitinophagaceae bacterium]|jgi:peptidyl-prolyl cis-trans isomerase A (cyclophilin A)|nr:peptidylprolyl isomerase [Chitinophagaceae bacterium]
MKSILYGLSISGLFIFLVSCGGKSPDHVIIKTPSGEIEVQLFPEKAPKTVKAFLGFVDAGLYKNSSFYRILSTDNQPTGANAAELIQGGIYKTEKSRDSIPGIPHEPTSITGLTHTHGTVSMARLEAGSATTEFFICIGDNPSFDAGYRKEGDTLGYAAFGKVVRGMDVVVRIYNRPEENQEFSPPVGIINIIRK